MSGIAGIYYLDGRPVERGDVEKMIDSIAHRGPDGSGVWTDGSVGLGHRMLWTTPESLHEKLPLTNKTGDLTITADARIDNRDELIPTLNLNGRPRETIPDSEIILAAYEKWGEKCPEKLLGDFSFAIWDKRNHKIYCARDHMGVKPFYYYHSNKAFVFASEIKALLSLPEVPCRLNEVRVADYLVEMFEDKGITFYKEILRLPPSHRMIVSHEKALIGSYWTLDSSEEIDLGSNDKYAEAFLDIFKRAVDCRLRSAFPIGSLLSGGLDSSSIVCMARQLLLQGGKGRLHTFSAIFDDVRECDERLYINAVLASDGLEPHFVHADRISPLADLDHVFHYEDEALLGPNLFMHWSLYNAAKAEAIRVLLDGIDGDTTVSHGIAFITELARAWQWKTLALEIKDLSKHLNKSPIEMLWHRVIKPLAPEAVRQAWRILRRRNQPAWARNSIINPDFARRIGLKERIQALQGEWSKPARTEKEHHLRGLASGLIPVILEMADKAAAAFSLEPRYPFFDRRLVEFCLGLPPEQKLNQGWTRMVMRRAMVNILPEEVQWRHSKSDLSLNFIRGLITFERNRLEQVILDESKIVDTYVDTAALRKVFRRYIEEAREDDAFKVWIAVTLAMWLSRRRLRL
jgi:asparagine synthase (glutamine-hydrolysing)